MEKRPSSGKPGESFLDVRTTTRDDCFLARPVGTLDGTTYRWLRDQLVKLAMEEPKALIVDLVELHIDRETMLTAFSAAWMRVSTWPGVPILLVAGTEPQRSLLRGAISRHTPCYATVAEALAAADNPPPWRRASVALEATPTSNRVARAFVRHTCQQWNVGVATTIDAVVVATELMDNVALHAGTGSEIRLEMRDRWLTVAVRDGSPHPAVLRERLGGDQRGNGLRIVAGLARTWGCSPRLGGGKVVWAVLVIDRS